LGTPVKPKSTHPWKQNYPGMPKRKVKKEGITFEQKQSPRPARAVSGRDMASVVYHVHRIYGD
jgi:hypothetical protein